MVRGTGHLASVTVPTSVMPGDGLVLFVSVGGTGSVSAPTGWTAEGTRLASSMRTALLSKVATAADAGARVTVSLSQQQKTNLVVAAYSGTDPDDPIHAFASAGETTSRSGHTTPMITATEAGTLAVSYWSDKSSGTTSWTAPASQTVRHTSFGTGGGRISALLTDPGSPGTAGSHGGITATANTASDKATMWTVLLAPAQPAGNQPPTADFDVSCTGLECDFDGTGSDDPDGTIDTWAWDFGDGDTATEASPTHTFGSADSYQVTLTVTDNGDATDTHTETVTVDVSASTPVAFRAVGRGAANWTSASVTVPSSVMPGDGLVLFVSVSGTGSVWAPTGWTAEGTRLASSMRTALLSKVATAADAGARVTVSLSQQHKTEPGGGRLLRHRPGRPDPRLRLSGGDDQPLRAHHPHGHRHRGGDPGGLVLVGQILWDHLLDGPGRPDGAPHLLRERWGPDLGAAHRLRARRGRLGSHGGITATANTASDKATMWTVLLAPAQPVGNQPPTADFDVSCTGLECDFDGTGSDDPDGTIDTWAWDFGDGDSATEASPTHTFGSADSYQVTLTVTDDGDATDTHTETVTVPVHRGRHHHRSRATSPRASATSRLRARWRLPKCSTRWWPTIPSPR